MLNKHNRLFKEDWTDEKRRRILSTPVKRGKEFETLLNKILGEKLAIHKKFHCKTADDANQFFNSIFMIESICIVLDKNIPQFIYKK